MSIIDFTTNIRFRIDFFSIPDTCRRIVDAIFSINKDCVPERRLMTSYDQNLIDLDSISSVLDVTLEEILQKQVFIFTKKIIGGYESRLYVAENFFFANITIGEDTQSVNLDSISKELGIMVEAIMQTVKDTLSIRRITTTIYAPCIMDEDSVEGKLDLSYFPIIKEKGVNARYAETYEYADFYSTVIRDISSGDYDVDHERRNGYRIEFMVNCYMNKLPSDIIKQLSLMFEKSTENTDKYFI